MPDMTILRARRHCFLQFEKCLSQYDYSVLSAFAGSSLTARRKGRKAAMSAMTHRRKPAVAKTATLPGATPKRKPRMERAEMRAVTAPRVMPMSIILNRGACTRCSISVVALH